MSKKRYLHNKQSGEKFCINGMLQSTIQPEDCDFVGKFSDEMKLRESNLPPKVDLRSEMTPVEDQRETKSCVANAFAGCYEYLLKCRSGDIIDVSRLFIYYNGRARDDPSRIIDMGSSAASCIEALKEHGVCLETIWPFEDNLVNTKPHDVAYHRAESSKVSKALAVNIDLNEMKTCLAQGYPFVFGLRLFIPFHRAGKSGLVPMPKPDDLSQGKHDRHAMVAVGYSDQNQCFIVRNSWGTNFGDKGYVYIPYDYMTNPEYCYDAWTIQDAETTEMIGRKNWEHIDDPIDAFLDDSVNPDYDDNNVEIIDEDLEEAWAITNEELAKINAENGDGAEGTEATVNVHKVIQYDNGETKEVDVTTHVGGDNYEE